MYSIHSELGKFNTFTESNRYSSTGCCKSLLLELFVCTDFSNGFSHQEQLSPSANYCLHYFGLSNKILIE